jgi:hypothetical protein
MSFSRAAIVSEQATQPLTADHRAYRTHGLGARDRKLQVERSVRSFPSGSSTTTAQHSLQVPAAKDQHPVEALAPGGADLPVWARGCVGPGVDHPGGLESAMI